MAVTRRTFLKAATVALGAIASGGTALLHYFKTRTHKKEGASYFQTVCPFCALHCSLRIYHKNKRVVSVEGLKKSPTNRGVLCARGKLCGELLSAWKGAATPSYRSSGATELEAHSYTGLVEKAAAAIKATRDETFKTGIEGISLNATEAIVSLLGSSLTNEDAYLANKFSRTIGLAHCGPQPLIDSFNAHEGFKETFGVSAQINPMHDIVNAKAILICGSNPVKNTTLLLKFLTEAKNNGAKIFVIDPELSEIARIADIHVQIRPGTDLIFLAGLIYYCFKNNLYDKEYLVKNTDAPFLINTNFSLDKQNGRFSGLSLLGDAYSDTTSWTYIIDERGNPKADYNLKKENSVFSILSGAYSNYTPDSVIAATGCSVEDLLGVAEAYGATGRPDSSGTVVVGGGFYEHSGAQGMRAVSILQMLCGNIGVPGGGITGLNLKMNEQGVCDQLADWNGLPGYLSLPNLRNNEADYEVYVKNGSRSSNDFTSINLFKNFEAHYASLSRAWFTHGTPESVFHFFPKADSSYNTERFMQELLAGKIKGLILFDIDLFETALNRADLVQGLKNLKWLILFQTRRSLVEKLKSYYEKLPAEVFFFPLFTALEKRASITSPDRVILPLNGRALADKEQKVQLYTVLGDILQKLAKLYDSQKGAAATAIYNSRWNYTSEKDIRREMNGVIESGAETQISSHSELKKEKTMCGNWLYAGLISELDSNKTAIPDYKSSDLVYSKWHKSWPENSRFLYNRCEYQGRGDELRELSAIREGDLVISPENKKARPFYFNREGVARLFAKGVLSGPFPFFPLNTVESYAEQSKAMLHDDELLLFNSDDTESLFAKHYTLYKEVYPGEALYLSPECARRLSIDSGQRVIITSGTMRAECVALVTERLRGAIYAKLSGKVSRTFFTGYSQGIDHNAVLRRVKIDKVL